MEKHTDTISIEHDEHGRVEGVSDEQMRRDIDRLVELKKEASALEDERTVLWRKAVKLNCDIKVLANNLGLS